MANKETGIENNEKQAKLLTVPDTSLPAYYVEEKMQEYFKTLSQFGPNLEMSHIGIGQVYFMFCIKHLSYIKFFGIFAF